MFDKIAVVLSGNTGSDWTAKEVSKLNETIKDVSNADIKARDRVDISLEEYENLKKQNAELAWELTHYEQVLDQIRIPEHIRNTIHTDSIEVSYCRDPMRFQTRVRIEFDVDDTFRELR